MDAIVQNTEIVPHGRINTLRQKHIETDRVHCLHHSEKREIFAEWRRLKCTGPDAPLRADVQLRDTEMVHL